VVAQSSEQPSCLHVQADKNLNPSTRDYAGSFAELLRKEDYEFSLKQLSEYVTASLVVGRPLLDRKPALSSAEWTAALAGSTAYICRKLGHTSPAWTRIPQLPFPWFPSEAYRWSPCRRTFPASSGDWSLITGQGVQKTQEDDAGRSRRRPLVVSLSCLAAQANGEGFRSAERYCNAAVFCSGAGGKIPDGGVDGVVDCRLVPDFQRDGVSMCRHCQYFHSGR